MIRLVRSSRIKKWSTNIDDLKTNNGTSLAHLSCMFSSLDLISAFTIATCTETFSNDNQQNIY